MSSLRKLFRAQKPLVYRRMASSVKVGDKVPIAFMNGEQDPVIKADDEYPDWLHTLHEPLKTKGELEKMWKNDPDSLNEEELRRYYRLIGLSQIKEGRKGGDF